jgi:hypothetical protein
MGSSSGKKDKKKEKRRRSRDQETHQEQSEAESSATTTSSSGAGASEHKHKQQGRQVSVQLAKGVLSADSREQVRSALLTRRNAQSSELGFHPSLSLEYPWILLDPHPHPHRCHRTPSHSNPPPPHQDKADPLVLPPLLATFPHGAPRDAQALRFRCRASSQGGGQRQRRRLQLAAETDHVAYEGEGLAVARKARAKYVVGVYSKSRGAVTLYPVESLLALGQRVKGADPQAGGTQGAKDKGKDKDEAMSYAERRKSLVETFGTKKKRRVMQSQEENRIRAAGVVGLGALGDFLADSVKAVKEEAAAQGSAPSAAEATRATLLPPYDANARTADRVYSARRVLPGPDAWEALGMDVQRLVGVVGLDGVDGVVEVDPEALRTAVLDGWRHWPAFVKSRVEDAPMPTAIPNGGDGGGLDARWEHLCALLLLRHLFDIHRLPPVVKNGAGGLAKMLGSGVEGEPMNEVVAEACLAAFFQQAGEGGGQRHTRTKPLTDKLLLHILVLCLIVGGYRVSASK